MFRRKFNCNAFVEFYLLEGIDYHLNHDTNLIPREKQFLPSVQYLNERLSKYKSEFNHAFSLVLRDYLWFAAIGEARHSERLVGATIKELESISGITRNGAYEKARKFTPTDNNIDILISLFEDYPWGDTYGGDAWAEIVKSVKLYNTLDNASFIDHCADLQHNGGVAFDKRIHFWSTTGSQNLLNFLDFKFHADSVVFDISKTFSTDQLRSILSKEAVYLLNKLFAVSGRSLTWNKDFRLISKRMGWDTANRNNYIDNMQFTEIYDGGYCANCGCKYNPDLSWTDGYGETYCEDCYYHCDTCFEDYAGQPYASEHGLSYCEHCWEEEHFTCNGCGEEFHNDDLAEKGMCEDCFNDWQKEQENKMCGLCEGTDAVVNVINIDEYYSDVKITLEELTNKMCVDCIKSHMNAGYKFFYTTVGLVMSTDIDSVLENPFGELLEVHVEGDFTDYTISYIENLTKYNAGKVDVLKLELI